MLQKIIHLFQRLPGCLEAFPGNFREFGFKVAALQFWDVLIPIGKSKAYIEALSDYMIRQLAPLTEKYRQGNIPAPSPKRTLDKIPIWVCWWQGEAQMPPIVRACVAQMRRCLPEQAELHIITWDNLRDYIDVPDFIMDKYQKGRITNVHLTDILRYSLISTYGGAWIDSTVLLSDRIREMLPNYLNRSYFTQHFDSWEKCPQEACRGKWCNFFFMGRRDCPLFSFVYEALLHWWQRHDRLIDYVIVDYVLWAAYEGVPAIREAIDAVPAGNENIWLLSIKLNEPYESEAFDALLGSNDFFKLSYKGQLDLQTSDGQKTVYSHLLER